MKKIRSLYLLLLCGALMLAMVSCTKTVANSPESAEAETEQKNAETKEKVFDLSSYSVKYNKIGLEEAKEIVEKAKDIYKKNDRIEMDEDVTISTSPVPELSIKDVNEISDAEDEQLHDYLAYISRVSGMTEAMLEKALPENAVLYMKGETNFPYPNYYFVDYEAFGFASSYDAYVKVIVQETCDPKEVGDHIYVFRGRIYYYDAENKEDVVLFPSIEEYEVYSAILKKMANAAQNPDYIEKHDADIK